MKWIIVVSALVAGFGVAAFNYAVEPNSDVSFSEIEKVYQDLDLPEMQQKLKDVRAEIKKSVNLNAADYKLLNRRQVVLTKLIIFKKHGHL